MPAKNGDLKDYYDDMNIKTAEALKRKLKYVIASFLDSVIMKYTAGGRKTIVKMQRRSKKVCFGIDRDKRRRHLQGLQRID